MAVIIKQVTTESEMYVTYKLDGITYVPHYTKDFYVGPGYSRDTGITDRQGNRYFAPDSKREFSSTQLEKAGGKKVTELLWVRAKFKAQL